jgi:hypothetical protein
VLALLAFACVPALAQAECTDSSCVEYEVQIPHSGAKKQKHPSPEGQNGPKANASNENGSTSEGSQPSRSGADEGEEGKHAGAAGGKGDDGNGNGGGQDKAG